MKKIKYHKIAWWLSIQFLLLFGFDSKAQQNETFNLDDVTENIVLNTDRDIYFAGEEIYFSAEYFINHLKVKPAISNVLYVELINCFDKTRVVQKKYEIKNHNANGSIIIPDGIASGNYMLRAYTQYQRNFGYLNFSYHFLTILNPRNNENGFAINQNIDSIEVIPEGNLLLENLKNNVVIWIPKHLIEIGNHYFLADGSLNIIENVEVSEKGFAQVEMVGHVSENYNFLIKKSNGDAVVKAFPKVQATGIQTQTKQFGSVVEYQILAKGMEQLGDNLIYQIKALSNDFKTCYTKNITVSNSSLTTQIGTDVLNEGVNYIVLTNANGDIEKVNTIFIQQKSVEEINVVTQKDRFAMRENVSTHLELKNSNNKNFPVVSVTVAKHGTQKEGRCFNPSPYLKSALLLQDYLQNQPEMDKETRTRVLAMSDKYVDLDLFAAQMNRTAKYSMEFIPEIRNLTISGIIREKTTLNPVSNLNIYLSVLFNSPQLHVCKSSENGAFIFSLNNVRGINDIFISPENAEDDDYEILITNPFANEIPVLGEIPALVDSSDAELIDEIYMNAQISQRFYPVTEKESQQRERKSTFNIDNGKSTTLLADFVTLKNMEELFTEIVPTAKYRKNRGQYSFAIFDSNGNVISENPLLLLDKIPIFDANKIMQLDISLIEKVEVINKIYILGESTFNGVIMLTSKTKNFAAIKFPESAVFIEYPTIQESEGNKLSSLEKLPVDKRIPDFRTTLFWEPNIQLGPNGIDFNFQTSDRKGVYDIIVRAFSSDGQAYFGKKQIVIE